MRVDIDEALIDLIYECGCDPGLWPRLLSTIAGACGGASAGLYGIGPEDGGGRLVATHAWPDERVASLAAESRLASSARNAARLALLPRGNTGCVVVDSGPERVALALVRSGRVVGALEIGAGSGEGLSADAAEFARRLSPHLARALLTGERFAEETARAAICRGALEQIGQPVLLLDARGRILLANAAAARLLATDLPLSCCGDRLVGDSEDAREILRRIVRGASAAAQDANLAEPDGTLLRLSWLSLPGGGAGLRGGVRLVALSRVGGRDAPVEAAARHYALTAAETQVLARVLAGETLVEAARNLGVCHSTVKTHLCAIFRKSDTRRRVDLVRRTLALGAQLGA
jgi:DNA-binding CsgD family transcriptional regulator